MSDEASVVLADEDVYRNLQERLDELPVGYPPTESGVEIRILKQLFTPEEANIASMLKFSWKNLESLEKIYDRMKVLGYSLEDLEEKLDNIAAKGGILALKEGDKKTYGLAQFIVGIFEFQVNKLTKQLVEDIHQYLDEAYIMDMAKIPISQLRTIPVGITLEDELGVTNYDDVKKIIESTDGPFTIINCVCRQARDLLDEPCKITSRREVCMGFGHAAQAYNELGWGRQISKEEAIQYLQKNQEEGMIFQVGNAQKPDFICSCCSCCCEGLVRLKTFPNPADLTTSNYYAEIEPDLCTGCQTCIDRCQMDAISFENDISSIIRQRCIGCGNCVVVCPSEAITLQIKDKPKVPPMTQTDLYNEIMEAKTKIKKKEARRKSKIEQRGKK